MSNIISRMQNDGFTRDLAFDFAQSAQHVAIHPDNQEQAAYVVRIVKAVASGLGASDKRLFYKSLGQANPHLLLYHDAKHRPAF